jgi:hypothetical protein
MDRDGDVNVGSYYDGQDGEKDFFKPEGIPYQTLYNELVDINTKLHSVRDTLQTTVSLDAFHSFNLDNTLPRGLIYDYEGNRDRGEDDDYPPDYEDCVDFLDFGTFVCPYTGVRYFAVSDRFCNWPPATFPDPSEEDEVTVRHPGRIIFDVYDDDPNPHYVTFFNIDNNHHGNGTSTFDVDLRNADGRIFKLDPCLNYNPGFEDDEHTFPADWTLYDDDGIIGGVIITDEEARKGDWSLKIFGLYETGHVWLDNDMHLDIDEDVFSGMTYRLSGYVKSSPGSTARTELRVVLEETVPAVAETPPVYGGTNWVVPDGWVYTAVDFEMPEPYEEPPRDTIWTEIGVSDGDENSALWFDEVRLEPLSRVFNGHFEYDVGDWWIGPVHGWGYNGPAPQGGWGYERSTPGKYGDYCLKVTGKTGKDNVVRNDEKLYLGKGTNYAVTGWARRGLTVPGVNAEVVVEFYASNGDMFNKKSYTVPTGGNWQNFSIPITPDDWEYYIYPIQPNTSPAYVRIACKMEAGSGDAYFDNIELIETNLIANGSFELAEEGPHWPDEWHYTLAPIVPPGDPAWSALYDADARYDRRCWRVRGPATGSVRYGSDTFPLYANTSYRLSGWMRSFDVDNRIDEGCYLKLDFYDVWGNVVDSYETDIVASEEDWTYKYVDFTPPDEGPGGEIIRGFARVTVFEEGGAYSSAADGIRVLPTGSSQ